MCVLLRLLMSVHYVCFSFTFSTFRVFSAYLLIYTVFVFLLHVSTFHVFFDYLCLHYVCFSFTCFYIPCVFRFFVSALCMFHLLQHCVYACPCNGISLSGFYNASALDCE